MSVRADDMPDGFVVRLHDEVEVGTHLVAGPRVVRLSATARQMLTGRNVRVVSRSRALLADRLLDLDLADPVLDDFEGPNIDEVTVVVPVRDNACGVDRILAACADRVRCVIVDDASHDALSLSAVAGRHGAQLVRLDLNMGPAAARNAGLRHVSTPYVAFVDSDVHVTVDALRRLARHFADPALAAVAPRVLSTGGHGWLQGYERACGSLDLGPTAASTRPWSRVAYVPSACLVARVADLGRGFDPTMRSGEDVDLVWRLNEAGLRVRHAADVQVLHDSRTSLGGWLARKAFYGTSAAGLAERHGDRMAPAVLTPAAAVAAGGFLLQRRWTWASAVIAATMAVRQTWASTPDLPIATRMQVVRSTASGVAWQASGLVLRHWAPAALTLCLGSRRARRVVGTLALVDGVLAHRAARPDLGMVRFVLARRAEHIAYGFGVWAGAARARSTSCLTPHWLSGRSRRSR